MVIKMHEIIYEKHSKNFFILDFDHLFISTNLYDEEILISGKNSDILVEKTKLELFKNFEINFDRNKDLENYSGGEKVMIALVFYALVFEEKKQEHPKILLINMLESLSNENKNLVNIWLKNIISGVKLYSLDSDAISIKEV